MPGTTDEQPAAALPPPEPPSRDPVARDPVARDPVAWDVAEKVAYTNAATLLGVK